MTKHFMLREITVAVDATGSMARIKAGDGEANEVFLELPVASIWSLAANLIQETQNALTARNLGKRSVLQSDRSDLAPIPQTMFALSYAAAITDAGAHVVEFLGSQNQVVRVVLAPTTAAELARSLLE